MKKPNLSKKCNYFWNRPFRTQIKTKEFLHSTIPLSSFLDPVALALENPV